MFTMTLRHLDAMFDASGSYDPSGTIVAYDWDFGDGTVGSGMIVNHTFPGFGIYNVCLTVTNQDGVTSSMSRGISLSDRPPTASFTRLVNGNTVYVDASSSSDDYGIVSYEWDWGDGTKGTGVTASHTYTIPDGVAREGSPPLVDSGRGFPFQVWGYTTDSNGTTLTDCYVEVKNLRTGFYVPTFSDSTYGFYQLALDGYYFPGGVFNGDTIEVTAYKGEWYGKNQGIVDYSQGFLWVDVKLDQLAPYPMFTITLSVTDTLNQTDTESQTIVLERPLLAEFWYQATYLTATFNASASSEPAQIVSYLWDWGDGSPLQITKSPECTHTYLAYATYSVTLTVEDSAGRTASVSNPVMLIPPGPP
jgi:PKD repeat protein